MGFMESLVGDDKVLLCMCIEWSTDEQVDHTIDTRVDSKTGKRLRVGEWSGMRLLDSITVNGVCPNP